MSQPPPDLSWIDYLQDTVAALAALFAIGTPWPKPGTGAYTAWRIVQMAATAYVIAVLAIAGQVKFGYPWPITAAVAVAGGLVGIAFITAMLRMIVANAAQQRLEKAPPPN